ncbi:hypothetical protein G7Y79_00011g029640 [Physcia stellaris]|nr:hypothetical protein G7Y79_00011g029640 [Physcia stellaris]
MRVAPLFLLVFSFLLPIAISWTPADHEIFRLRDEIAAAEGPETTFYDFVGQSFIVSRAQPTPKSKSGHSKKKPGVHVSKPPSESEIQAHVKKASERYARLGVIAQILKGPGRERYDFFLENGFPKWRGTGYYYARFRPGLGTVLAGLFVLGGGGAHYAALYVSWKRQREFVERYIRHARRAAWGDEVGIKGIPGVDPDAVLPAPAPVEEETAAGNPAMNRRQKRMQEKESRKEKDKGGRNSKLSAKRSGTNTPLSGVEVESTGPQGPKKKVQAENGKMLIVDSVGNVYLEEEDENGDKREFLLDPEEIPRPTWRQTVLVRLPIWVYSKAKGKVLGNEHQESTHEDSEEDGSEQEGLQETSRKTTINGNARKRRKATARI